MHKLRSGIEQMDVPFEKKKKRLGTYQTIQMSIPLNEFPHIIRNHAVSYVRAIKFTNLISFV